MRHPRTTRVRSTILALALAALSAALSVGIVLADTAGGPFPK